MVKPHERNTCYVDAVLTIPKVCIKLLCLLMLNANVLERRCRRLITISPLEPSCCCNSSVHSCIRGALQGSLFPMCGMNLAFNRDLIGPSMYFGLMGDGQPLGRYDDMWAGWCSKVTIRCPPTHSNGLAN